MGCYIDGSVALITDFGCFCGLALGWFADFYVGLTCWLGLATLCCFAWLNAG